MSALIFFCLILGGLASAQQSPYTDPHCEKGTVGIVHLFEWRWSDIERECPRLSQIGYCGVQTSVPTEHKVLDKPTWLERYLPVSYKLSSRSGDENEFESMVQACEAVGIRIFVTLQLDHMSVGVGAGYNGSLYNDTSLDYPGVPFNVDHFHTADDCSSTRLTSSSSPSDMQKCRALGYPDLDQTNPYVRDTLVNLLNTFISKGVSGFFLTNALHIAPQDLEAILNEAHDVTLGGRPFVVYEMVNTLSTSVDPRWYYPIGRVTDYSMSQVFGKTLLDNQDLSQLCLLLNSSTVIIPREYASVLPAEQAVVFVHDVNFQRGRSPKGVKVVTYKDSELYKLALSFMFATGNGIPKVMSSYDFVDPDQGPPIDDQGNTLEVSQTSGSDCGNGWICEHRYSDVEYMINFSSVFSDQKISNCKSEKTKVSFSRGDTGHYWAALGAVDEIWDDLPKEVIWDDKKNDYVEQLKTDGLKLMEFGGIATVAFFKEPLTTTAIHETSTEASTSTMEKRTTTPTTIKSTSTEPTTIEPTAAKPTTADPTTIESTMEEATTIESTMAEATTIETTMAEATTNKPTTADPTTIEPTRAEPTTNNPKTADPTTIEFTTQQSVTTEPSTTTESTRTPSTTATTETTKKPKPTSDFQRTVILIKKTTRDHEKVFIRGGNGDPEANDAIPIKHLKLNMKTPERDQWARGDNFLDWGIKEKGQNRDALGTPAQWTTSKRSNDYYSRFNTYGDHFWLVDVMMDCSRTHQGFFEFRGVLQNGFLESARSLGRRCTGGKNIPRNSKYHLGMCGKVNVFYWGQGSCKIKNL